MFLLEVHNRVIELNVLLFESMKYLLECSTLLLLRHSLILLQGLLQVSNLGFQKVILDNELTDLSVL